MTRPSPRPQTTQPTRLTTPNNSGSHGPVIPSGSPGRALSTPVAVDPASDAGCETVRLRLGLAYDGAGFSGWARQPGRRTVQETVEVALGRLLRLPGPPALTVAGRTDTGVHARGQVAHVDVPAAAWAALTAPAAARVAEGAPAAARVAEGAPAAARVAEPVALRRMAGLLPPDVRARFIAPAPPGFDARFSALWRRYCYRVCDDLAAADPLRRGDTLWHRSHLDLDRMNEAAAGLTGEHDFAAFCRKREGASTVRSLIRLTWSRPAPGLAAAEVVADAFCHNMVRALVGALLAVGDGRKPPDWPAQVLKTGIRDPAVHVIPPHGLCLEEVHYPPDDALAHRATQTRRRRD
jgi:tRNA pseudouridine38-40 synthase